MDHLTTPEGRRLAYHWTLGEGPGVMFLGGFRSDMTGTKAVFLEDWALARGQGFLRFDYSGHGASSGRFEDGAIGDWLEDSIAALKLTDGPQILVGSSMGGWLALLLARARPERVKAVVTIAAAPEFPASMWAEFTEDQRREVMEQGVTARPSDYGEPYPITRRLIEEAKGHGLYDRPMALGVPLRLLQGSADADVPMDWALRLFHHATGDVRLTVVKGADHRFSTPECLELIARTVEELC